MQVVAERYDVQSGATLSRKGLDEVRALLATGAARALILFSRDRGGRDTLDLLTLRKELRGLKVEIHYTDTGRVEMTPGGTFADTVLAGAAQFEKETIVERSIDGRARTVAAGTYDVDANVAAALAAEIDPAIPVAAVSTSNRTFSANGDCADYFTAGKRCRVTGGSANDGTYTVASVVYSGGQTTVTVAEAIASATVAGNLRGYVGASASSATVTLTGYALPAGAGDAGDFSFSLAVSASGGGTIALGEVSVPHQVKCVVDGPVEALAASLTIIATPVSGWTSTTNLLAADEGNLLETDVDARQRRSESLRTLAIETRLAALAGVDDVVVYRNDTGAADDAGRPAHSIECVVTGGDDDAIAECIYTYKAAGVQTYGNSVQVITDSQGLQRTILFSRPTDLDIYVDVTVDTLYSEEDLPVSAADAIKEAVVTYGNTLAGGKNVIASRLAAAVVLAVPGLENVTVKIATSASPTVSTTIAVSATQVARFDEARCTVSGV